MGANDEVDALLEGVVVNDAYDQAEARENTRIVNEFFNGKPPTKTPRQRLQLPAGTIWIEGTLNLINHENKTNNLGLRGQGIGKTTLKKKTDGCLIMIAGYYNYIGDMTLSGPVEGGKALGTNEPCGLYLLGHPQKATLYGEEKCIKVQPSRFNTFKNLRIEHFYVGIRVGHHSGLQPYGGGDKENPDIVANLWETIILAENVYGLIRDGQNILNDRFLNFYSDSAYRHHVYLPHGGDFRCDTAQFAATLHDTEKIPTDAWPQLDSDGNPLHDASDNLLWPKIHSSNGDILIINARSENGEFVKPPDGKKPYPQPAFLRVIDAHTHVELHEVEITNEIRGADNKPIPETKRNLAVDLQGGRATFMNCHVDGTIKLSNTQYIGVNNEVGAYNKIYPALALPNNTIILDAAVGSPEGDPNTIQLDITDFAVDPVSPDPRSSITLNQRGIGNEDKQSKFVLSNQNGTAVIATEGLHNGIAGDVIIHIDGTEVFKQSKTATHPKHVGCAAYNDNPTFCTAGVWTPLPMIANQWDTHDFHNLNKATPIDPSRFEVPFSGRYRVNARARFSTGRTPGDRGLQIAIIAPNSTMSEELALQVVPSTSSIDTALCVSVECYLSDKHLVSIMGYSSSDAVCKSVQVEITYLGLA